VTAADFEPLSALLARHRLDDVDEEPFANDGWSGASMTLLRRGDGGRFVLKRDSLAHDWIAQATRDGPVPREAWFAAHGPDLPAPVRAPYLGVGVEGEEYGILMPDLTGTLFDWERPISVEALERVLVGLAALHAPPLASSDPPAGRWCPLRERLTLICRASLERHGPARDAVGDRILPGWDAFDRVAPSDVRDVINGLGEDPSGLVAVLREMTPTLIHGDLKLANVGIASDGAIELVDWQMVMVAPVAVELGWFLVSNVASLPLSAKEVIERYRWKLAHAVSDVGLEGRTPDDVGLDEDGVAAAILIGLLLRGWKKGYDTEAGVVHASGLRAADDLAWWSEQAIGAAGRLF
jgi:hypothetical protein